MPVFGDPGTGPAGEGQCTTDGEVETGAEGVCYCVRGPDHPERELNRCARIGSTDTRQTHRSRSIPLLDSATFEEGRQLSGVDAVVVVGDSCGNEDMVDKAYE